MSCPGRIALDTRDAGEVDATLSGSPISLLSLVGPGAEDRLRGSSIRIAGDAEVVYRRSRIVVEEQRGDGVGGDPGGPPGRGGGGDQADLVEAFPAG